MPSSQSVDFVHTGLPQQRSLLKDYCWAMLTTAVASILGWGVAPRVGYGTAGMVYLLSLVLAALKLGRGPLLLMAALSVLCWDYFFIPPSFTFGIEKTEDILVCIMFFVVVLGIFSVLLRHREMLVKSLEHIEMVRASDRLRQTLLDSISHELKTPLAAIQTATEEISHYPAEAHRYVPELRESLRRMRRTVDNLLNMTRLESGDVMPLLDWCDVDELCESAVDLSGGALAAHYFSVALPRTLPLVKIDRALIEQALVNLLLNAAMHTPPGCEVVLKARVEGKVLYITISDRGPGLPTADAEKLFQKFVRGHQAPAGGSGLGLSIARGFVRAHGGDLTACALPEGGAEFSVSLPVETLIDEDHEIRETDSSDH